MKKQFIIGSFLALSGIANAQNIFPTSGNAGIGTTTPSDNLDIRTSSTNGGITIVQNSTTNASLKLLSSTGRRYDLCSTGTGNGTAGNFSIFDFFAGADRLMIQGSTGFIGIGTSSPGAKLGVKGLLSTSTGALTGINSLVTGTGMPGNTNTFTGIAGSANSADGSSYNVGIGGSAYYGLNNYGGTFLATGAGNTGGNNIGIYATYSGVSGNDWAGYFVGSAYTTGVFTSSDQKLKNNIKPLTKALEKIKLLKPSTYTYRTDEFKSMNLPEGEQMGLIAQDLELIYPQLIKTAGNTSERNSKGEVTSTTPSFKSVNYIGLIPVLISAVQEQQAQIADLQNQVATLTNKTGSATGINQLSNTPDGFALEQNVPNPFSQETVVKYNLPQQFNNASMVVYDLSGKQIAAFPITEKGSSSMTITSEKLSAGIYIYSVMADGKILDSKRMVVAQKQ